MNNAETIAHWAVTTQLSTIATCTTTDATCRKQFITSFGKRAFRAPLSDVRVPPTRQLFMAESSFADGAEAVIGAMLQSPYFLYRSELACRSAQARAAGDVDAARGGDQPRYLLTGSMPDDTLLAAADTAAQQRHGAADDAQLTACSPIRAPPTTRCASSAGWFGLDCLTNASRTPPSSR